jgi:hypothetical protein
MLSKSRIPAFPSRSTHDMNRWFHKLYLAGLLYHLDEPAESIISLASGQPTFTLAESIQLNNTVKRSMKWDFCTSKKRWELSLSPLTFKD